MFFLPLVYLKILNRLHLLTFFRLGYTFTILNSTFRIPVIEKKQGFSDHRIITEMYLVKIFQRLYKNHDFLFLDVGVNFGQTLLKVKAISASASYIGFEPSILCAYYTKHLIKVNRMQDARVIQCALSDKMGHVTLYAQSEGDTRASLLSDQIIKEDTKVREIVPALTLDSLIPVITEAKKEIILKVDVEGAELMVFEGAEQLVKDYRPVIVFENLPCGTEPYRQQQQKRLSDFFATVRYDLFLLNEEKETLEKITSVNNIDNYERTNYLALPSEKQFVLAE
jgi:FkbM family methyltransferase